MNSESERMSRRTKSFLLALIIFTIPLALLLAENTVTQISNASNEQSINQTVEARISEAVTSVPTLSIDDRVSATLSSLSATAAPVPLDPTTPPRQNGQPGLLQQVITFIVQTVAAIVSGILGVILDIFIYAATALGLPAIVGQCCCCVVGLGAFGVIFKVFGFVADVI